MIYSITITILVTAASILHAFWTIKNINKSRKWHKERMDELANLRKDSDKRNQELTDFTNEVVLLALRKIELMQNCQNCKHDERGGCDKEDDCMEEDLEENRIKYKLWEWECDFLK